MRSNHYISRILIGSLMCLLTLGVTPLTTQASELPSQYTLGQAVPANMWLYIHAIHNEERAFVEREWAELWSVFEQSGIVGDLLGMFTAELSPEEKAEVESFIKKFQEMVFKVDWSNLVGREFVFAERLSPPFPAYVMLFRGSEGSTDKNINALTGILHQLSEMSEGEITVTTDELHSANIWTIAPGGAPFRMDLFRRGDVIGIVVAPTGASEVIKMLAGEGEMKSIIETPRFKKAIAQVPAPEDVLTYVDFRKMFEDIGHMINFGFQQGDPQALNSPEHKMVASIMDQVDVFDYMIATARMDGRFERSDEIVVLREDKKDSVLSRSILNRKAFAKFDKYIPKEATAFGLTTLIDFGELYHGIVNFVKTDIPEGAEMIAKMEGMFVEMNFDPDRDIFSWLSGEMISITMPAAVVTPMSPTDSVTMIRVKNPELAEQKVMSGINQLSGFFARTMNQPLIISDVAASECSLKQIMHPQLAMFVKPVVGVDGEWLIISTSAAAVEKVMAVAAGDAPSIRKNERFVTEGIIPEGAVTEASFQDLSNLGNELANAIGIFGFASSAAMAAIPNDDPEARKVKHIMTKVSGILMKLTPVFQQLDFFSSTTSVATLRGNVIHGRTVTAYKESAWKGEEASKVADGSK